MAKKRKTSVEKLVDRLREAGYTIRDNWSFHQNHGKHEGSWSWCLWTGYRTIGSRMPVGEILRSQVPLGEVIQESTVYSRND